MGKLICELASFPEISSIRITTTKRNNGLPLFRLSAEIFVSSGKFEI